VAVTACIGAYSIVKSAANNVSRFNRHYLRNVQDCYQKYGGDDSWVVVTGGTDGIGLEICKKMAKQGFNICIVGRNQVKMREKLAEILKHSPEGKHLKTKSIIADFSQLKRIDEYQAVIGNKLANIDIAMLFLNAGLT
jgi:17beta-estradiol 17-dehydrogenase / very-long-chain 3-oxoacyl-CoA reductase